MNGSKKTHVVPSETQKLCKRAARAEPAGRNASETALGRPERLPSGRR